MVGTVVGREGAIEGFNVGVAEGFREGIGDGGIVDLNVGVADGKNEGITVGVSVIVIGIALGS